MKKLLSVLFVAFLVLGVAGQASAYFERGNLVVSLSNDTDEMLVDLGAGTAIDWAAENVLLGNVGDYSAYTDIQVAYYSTDYSGVYTLPGTAAEFKITGFNGFINGMNVVYSVGENDDTDTLYYTIGENGSMVTEMGSDWNSMAGTTSATDIGEDIYVYYLSYALAGQDLLAQGDGTEYYATLTLEDNGDVVLNSVPVPGAVWMLGSALLGIVGIRKKKA